jgi:hypothetical protein
MTAILFANKWRGLESERDGVPATDGQWFLAFDTGNVFFRKTGAWVADIEGFISATKSGRIMTDSSGQAHVTFVTPFINNQYGVALSCLDPGDFIAAFKANLAATGFDIITRDKNGHTQGNITVSWVATRDYNP